LLKPIAIATHHAELHCFEDMGIARSFVAVLVLICIFLRGNSIVEE